MKVRENIFTVPNIVPTQSRDKIIDSYPYPSFAHLFPKSELKNQGSSFSEGVIRAESYTSRLFSGIFVSFVVPEQRNVFRIREKKILLLLGPLEIQNIKSSATKDTVSVL